MFKHVLEYIVSWGLKTSQTTLYWLTKAIDIYLIVWILGKKVAYLGFDTTYYNEDNNKQSFWNIKCIYMNFNSTYM